jgi:type VI secretion system secreted protein VgrG
MNTAVAYKSFEEVGFDKLVTVGKEFSMSAGNGMKIKAGEILVLECGASSITLNKSGQITIKGTAFNLETSGDIKLDGALIDLN